MSDVRTAAAVLESRPPYDGIPYERFTDEFWALIDARVPGYGPAWLRQLSTDFRIAGACFQLKVSDDSWTGRCILPRPSSALCAIYHARTAPTIEGLFKHRFVVFGDGQDGYGWVFKDDGNPDPPVFFFEESAWDGGEPSMQNGLVQVGLTFSRLLHYGATWKG